MLHSELVQTATDLLADSRNPESWLEMFDRALSSDTDDALIVFIQALRAEPKAMTAHGQIAA
jgi:hypothetical protein